MAKNNKVSMKQLRDATDVLMRFLEEYQTVNPQNSDAIVEYEGKLELIAAPLNAKKFATLDSYSLVDLNTPNRNPLASVFCLPNGEKIRDCPCKAAKGVS
jgi:hypothetical protein